MSSYIGKVQSFRVGDRMVPVEVVWDADGLLTVRSLDLRWTWRVWRSTWDKQAAILAQLRAEGEL